MWDSIIQLDQQLSLALNGGHSLFLDGIMMTLRNTWTWVPVSALLLFVIFKNGTWREVFLAILALALTIFLADHISSAVCKPLFHRFRPSQDPLIMYQIDVVNGYRGGLYGFISSHAANTFSVFAFTSLLLRSRIYTISMFFWAALVSYSRVYLGVHYLGDIFFGAIWGVIVGVGCYYLYRYIRNKVAEKNVYISSQYTSTGVLLSDIDTLLCCLYLTYFYVLIRALYFI